MDRYTLNRIVYWILQWTWGIIQNIVGACIWMVVKLGASRGKTTLYRAAFVTPWKLKSSLGIGMFVFLGDWDEEHMRRVLVHEYGHTLQSIILGPLFLLFIGLPSFIWAGLPVFENMRRRGRFSYYDPYFENWANVLGERVTHEKAPEKRKTTGGIS
ncbi:MAG: hypothetical protein K6F92_09640 [Lachnospiraceae bacterium]|nr:hypothetical protein [Lachnospiraceae bacterium]